MNNRIYITAPIRKYGDDVVNLNYVQRACVRVGVVIMADGDRLEFPPEVVAEWFSDTMDYGKCEKHLTGGEK